MRTARLLVLGALAALLGNPAGAAETTQFTSQVRGQDAAVRRWQMGTPVVTYWAGPMPMTDAVAKQMADVGVGQILPTSKATDGTKDGFDIELTRAIADETGLPVIASGGAGTLEHFAEAVTEGHAAAVLAASVFHFGTFTVGEVKQYPAAQNIPVNL